MDKQLIVISGVMAKKRALEVVNACMGDNIMQMTLEPYQHNKTDSQRNYWHMILGKLGDELGYNLPDIKDLMKIHIMGYEILTGLDGKEIERIPSSEKCKRFGYSKLIDGTVIFAADLGIILPTPHA